MTASTGVCAVLEREDAACPPEWLMVDSCDGCPFWIVAARCTRPTCNHLEVDHHRYPLRGGPSMCMVAGCDCREFVAPLVVTP